MVKTDRETIQTLMERGTVDVVVKEHLQDRLTSGKKLRVKFGIDPTGSGLHIGHAVPLKKLRQFQDAGHQAVLVVGTFTGKIGDPSGKTQTRTMLSDEQVKKNIEHYLEQAGKVIDVQSLEIRYNAEWLSPLSFSDVVQLSSLFTVQQMMQRDMYQERLKKDLPIGVHEFMYPLMQGYDSVALKADIELGGTDQLFNLLAGRPIQKAYGQEPQDIMTNAILEGLDGHEKMSKSLNNYIALFDKPNDMYGKAMSIPDELILKYFELATDVSLQDMEEIKKALKEGENPRNLKMRLGRELVTLYHTAEDAKAAEEYFVTMFSKKEIPEDIEEVAVKQQDWILVDLIAELKLTPSKSETRRMMQGGGVKINGEKITDFNTTVSLTKEPFILQVGKRKIVKVKIG
jgi:tyrosyl-tRNA synthetase